MTVGNHTTDSPKVAQNPHANAAIGRHGCGRCPNRWSGADTSHCGSCHETFTGIRAFDMHRAGSHIHGTRHCVEPEAAGLIPAGRAYPCWALPTTDTRWITR